MPTMGSAMTAARALNLTIARRVPIASIVECASIRACGRRTAPATMGGLDRSIWTARSAPIVQIAAAGRALGGHASMLQIQASR